MKRFFVAVVAAAALTGAVSAQTSTTEPAAPAVPVPPSSCGDPPPPPTPPDGATATSQQLTAGVATYEAWRIAAQDILACRAAEARTLQAQEQARVAEFNTFRTAGETAGAAWNAQIAAYNAAHPQRRRGR